MRTEMEFLEEKPSLCTVCGEAFTTLDALHVHKETEHQNNSIISLFPDEKPSLCTLCDEAFTTLDALHVHKETEHPNNDLFNLFLCPESMGQEKSKEHFKQHTPVEDPPETLQNEILTTVLKTDEPSCLNEGQQLPSFLSEPNLTNAIWVTGNSLIKNNIKFLNVKIQSRKWLKLTGNLTNAICVIKHSRTRTN